MELIVGSDGMIGGAMYAEAAARGIDVIGTSRRIDDDSRCFLDIEQVEFGELPVAEIAYIFAGIVGYKNCEGNPKAQRVNVDGTIRLVKKFIADGTFIVFMSSDAVEHMLGTAYGTQKALVEIFLQATTNPAIVRSGRIERNMLPDLCDLLLEIGKNRTPGIFNFVPKSHV